MSVKFNRTIAANAVITADAAIAANAVKFHNNGKMASDNPALLIVII